MLRCSKNEGGFSLVEAMIATMITAIAFVGVFSLTTFSAKQVNNSQAREKMQIIANQIFEIIESDSANISNYAGTLATCTVPATGETRKYVLRKYEWCTRLNATAGSTQLADIRTINVTALGGENILTLTLTSANAANKIIVKRTYR